DCEAGLAMLGIDGARTGERAARMYAALRLVAHHPDADRRERKRRQDRCGLRRQRCSLFEKLDRLRDVTAPEAAELGACLDVELGGARVGGAGRCGWSAR